VDGVASRVYEWMVYGVEWMSGWCMEWSVGVDGVCGAMFNRVYLQYILFIECTCSTFY
jgi:hypothetical protein